MTADDKAAYEQALAEWEESNYNPSLYPDPANYMTEEKKQEYLQDVAEYNNAAQIFNEKLYEYYDIRDAIFSASVGFVQNTMTLNREGTMAASTSVVSKPGDFEPIKEYAVYILDLNAGTHRHIETGRTEILPGQIVADGTVICSSSVTGDYVTRGYLVKKGSDELLPIQDYLGAINPEYNTWIIDNLSFTAPVEENGEARRHGFHRHRTHCGERRHVCHCRCGTRLSSRIQLFFLHICIRQSYCRNQRYLRK